MTMQNTTNWQFSDMPTAQIIYIRLDAINEVTEAIILMLGATIRLFDSLNRLLQLTLVLIAIVLECAEMAVSVCNRIYRVYAEIDRQLVRWFSRLVYVPVYRGIG